MPLDLPVKEQYMQITLEIVCCVPRLTRVALDSDIRTCEGRGLLVRGIA